jgi:NADH:ubiquinone oxidoreductase subunit 5 (subunit L)/multisubunit Na+/H+ antiporter MnhA subunit
VLGHHFEGVLEEHLAGMPHGFSWLIFVVASLSAFAGIGLASLIWYKPILKIEKLAPYFGWLAKIVENKYYIDEIYQATIIRGLMLAAALMYWFDRWVIDYCIVNGVGWVSLVTSRGWGWFDRNVVDGLVNAVGEVTKFAGNTLRYFQTGVTQQYVFMLVGAVLLMCIAVLVGHYTEEAWIPIAGFYR